MTAAIAPVDAVVLSLLVVATAWPLTQWDLSLDGADALGALSAMAIVVLIAVMAGGGTAAALSLGWVAGAGGLIVVGLVRA